MREYHELGREEPKELHERTNSEAVVESRAWRARVRACSSRAWRASGADGIHRSDLLGGGGICKRRRRRWMKGLSFLVKVFFFVNWLEI